MGKYEKKKKKKKAPVMAVILTMLVLAILVVFVLGVMPQLLYRLSGEEETVPTEETQVTAAETAEPTVEITSSIEFPLTLEDGKLAIDSLFQFDGRNPDCENQDGDNTASLMVRNISGMHLAKAEFQVELSDGTKTHFVVMDLPAGETAMAFSADNASLQNHVSCVSLLCEADWNDGNDLIPDNVMVSVEGMTITVTNHSAQEIPELVIYCRAPFGEEYFGGKAYEYTVKKLPAYESATVEALDCIMGIAEVVRIAVNGK